MLLAMERQNISSHDVEILTKRKNTHLTSISDHNCPVFHADIKNIFQVIGNANNIEKIVFRGC